MQGTPLFSRHKKTHKILSSILFRSLVSKVALTVGGEHDHQPLKKHRDEHATGKNDDVVVIVCAPTRDAEREAKRRSICCREGGRRSVDVETRGRRRRVGRDSVRDDGQKRHEKDEKETRRRRRGILARSQKTHSEEHDYSNRRFTRALEFVGRESRDTKRRGTSSPREHEGVYRAVIKSNAVYFIPFWRDERVHRTTGYWKRGTRRSARDTGSTL